MDQTKVIGIIAVVVVLVIILIFVYRDRKTLEKLTGPNVPGYVSTSAQTNWVIYNPVLYKKLRNFILALNNISIQWGNFLQGSVQLKDLRNELSNYFNTALSLSNETKKFVALKPEYAQGLEQWIMSSIQQHFINKFDILGPLVGVTTPLSQAYPGIGKNLLNFAFDWFNYQNIMPQQTPAQRLTFHNNAIASNNLSHLNPMIPNKIETFVELYYGSISPDIQQFKMLFGMS